MCNLPHEDSKVPRRKKGYGWKLFEKGVYPFYSPFTYCSYEQSSSGWIFWERHLSPFSDDKEAGFCFFFNKKSMMRVVKELGDFRIARIRYEGAFARHKEKKLILNSGDGIDIGLCKKFKIIEFTDHWPPIKSHKSNPETI